MNRFHSYCCVAATLLLLCLIGGCSDSPSVADRPDAESEAAVDPHGHEEHEEGVVELTPEAAAGAGLRTATVEERVLEGRLTTTGQVDFDETRLAHVSPRISGRVHRVDAVLGQGVRAGQKLAEIDSIELGRAKAQFLQAKAIQELARSSFERTRALFADRIVSEQEVLEAEAALREATTVLQTAEETLHLYGLNQARIDALGYDDPGASIYPLLAPFVGTIVERHATLGELVTPETKLFTLANLERVWIWIDVYQRDLGRVHEGDGVEVRVDAYPDEVFKGEVSYLAAQIDGDTRTLRARLEVNNSSGKLRPGMFVEVELFDPHGASGKDGKDGTADAVPSLVVPESALVRDGETTLVFQPLGEHRFARREVLVGRKAGAWVEILSGLEPGSSVVVEGGFLLKSAASKESLGGGHDH